ncbi:MAG: OB-fold nucleic acid binding domain-containing protein, partial [Thermoanaerobaculia bacterium]
LEGLGAWGPGVPHPPRVSQPRDLKTSSPGGGASPQALKPPSPLPEMSPYDETLADYAGTGLTVGPHPLAHLRPSLDRQQIVPAARLAACAHGQRVRTAGSVTVRQRPGTAKGLLFLTLEDETGMSQALVTPDLLQANRQLIIGSPGLVVEGVLQKKDGTLSLKAERFWRLSEIAAAPSHDFR